MAQIRLPGVVNPNPPGPDLGDLAKHGASAENVQIVHAGARRAAERPVELSGLKQDTIVELSFDNGARFYHRYDQLAADLAGSRTRSRTDADTIEIPLVLPGPITRGGAAATVIEAVRTFDLDLSSIGEFAGELA